MARRVQIGFFGDIGSSSTGFSGPGLTPLRAPTDWASSIMFPSANDGVQQEQYRPFTNASVETYRTMWTQFTFRITNVPNTSVPIWFLAGNIEAGPSVAIRLTSAGLLTIENQGNQAAGTQILGNFGTPTVGTWYILTGFCQFRNDGLAITPACNWVLSLWETGATVATVTGSLPVPGSGAGLQNNGQLTNGQTMLPQRGASTQLGFDVCNWVADDTSSLAAQLNTRVGFLRPAANGTYQEFSGGGEADWRARAMYPFASQSTASLITTQYKVGSNGQRQTYLLESFASQGITGTIRSLWIHIFYGTGSGVNTGSVLIRRNGSDSTIVDTVNLPTTATWRSYRVDPTLWSATDTVEIGLSITSGAGTKSLAAVCLTVEHGAPYTQPTDTDFIMERVTWTGNGTAQTVALPFAPHFMLWFPTTATQVGGWWHYLHWSGMGNGSVQSPTRNDWRVVGSNLHLVGADTAGANVNARAYEALLIRDSTRRMLTGGLFQASRDNWQIDLFDINGDPFGPEFAMQCAISVNTSSGGYMRGPWNSGDSSTLWAGGLNITDWWQAFNAAGFQVGTAFQTLTNGHKAWWALRRNFVGPPFMSLSSYVGNAAAARDITLEMPGFTPDYVIVFPLTGSGASAYSTPGTTSGRNLTTGGAFASTILTVGENRITIGLSINSNLVVYGVLAFGLGSDPVPTPPSPPPPYPGPPLPPVPPVPSTLSATLLRLRRLRRCAHLSNEEFRIFYHRLQVDAQMGVGLGGAEQLGSDPQMMLRWSDDGGQTWSNELWVTMGRAGLYSARAIWDRLGEGRDRVFEIVVSDPVAWRIVDAYLQFTVGNS